MFGMQFVHLLLSGSQFQPGGWIKDIDNGLWYIKKKKKKELRLDLKVTEASSML